MKRTSFLLPHRWQLVGLIGFFGFTVLLIGAMQFNWACRFLATRPVGNQLPSDNLTDEVAMIGVIVSLLVYAFSRERVEDEYVQWHRSQALQAAVLVNYGVLLVGIATVYGIGFLGVLFWNMFTTLVLFAALFRIRLYRAARSLQKEVL